MIGFTPFLEPLYGGWDWWYVMLLPLALLIALVYKAMRCDNLADVPKQAALAFLKLVGAFVGCALVLWGVMVILEHRG